MRCAVDAAASRATLPAWCVTLHDVFRPWWSQEAAAALDDKQLELDEYQRSTARGSESHDALAQKLAAVAAQLANTKVCRGTGCKMSREIAAETCIDGAQQQQQAATCTALAATPSLTLFIHRCFVMWTWRSRTQRWQSFRRLSSLTARPSPDPMQRQAELAQRNATLADLSTELELTREEASNSGKAAEDATSALRAGQGAIDRSRAFGSEEIAQLKGFLAKVCGCSEGLGWEHGWLVVANQQYWYARDFPAH